MRGRPGPAAAADLRLAVRARGAGRRPACRLGGRRAHGGVLDRGRAGHVPPPAHRVRARARYPPSRRAGPGSPSSGGLPPARHPAKRIRDEGIRSRGDRYGRHPDGDTAPGGRASGNRARALGAEGRPAGVAGGAAGAGEPVRPGRAGPRRGRARRRREPGHPHPGRGGGHQAPGLAGGRPDPDRGQPDPRRRGAAARGRPARPGGGYLRLPRPGRRVDHRRDRCRAEQPFPGCDDGSHRPGRPVHRRRRIRGGAALRPVLRPGPGQRRDARPGTGRQAGRSRQARRLAVPAAPRGRGRGRGGGPELRAGNLQRDRAPVRRSEWAAAIGAAAATGPARFYPALAQRLAGPRAEPLTRSQRVDSAKFAAAAGWAPLARSTQGGWSGHPVKAEV